jgi:hypothetical protein
LHNLEMKRNGSPCESTVIGSRRPVFDIVNGFFKIDAVRCSILETRIASAVREALLCSADWTSGSKLQISTSSYKIIWLRL